MALFHRNPRIPPRADRRRIATRGREGFTIIEVALGTFVMALGISSAILSMQMGFKALNVARDTTLASQIMQSEIERVRLMQWNNPGGAVDSILELPASDTVALSTMFTANPQLVAKFSVTRTVTVDGSRADVRYITLAVTWNSYDGRSHVRSFTTMYCKNGLYDYYHTVAGT
jgi:Tfp pilus assembly protein PilV